MAARSVPASVEETGPGNAGNPANAASSVRQAGQQAR